MGKMISHGSYGASGLDEEPLVPIAFLPAQYDAVCRESSASTPEKRLLVAVLEAAVNDLRGVYRRQTTRTKRIHNEAREWILSDERCGPFAFLSICEALGFDAGALRWKLLDAAQVPPQRRRHEVARHLSIALPEAA